MAQGSRDHPPYHHGDDAHAKGAEAKEPHSDLSTGDTHSGRSTVGEETQTGGSSMTQESHSGGPSMTQESHSGLSTPVGETHTIISTTAEEDIAVRPATPQEINNKNQPVSFPSITRQTRSHGPSVATSREQKISVSTTEEKLEL